MGKDNLLGTIAGIERFKSGYELAFREMLVIIKKEKFYTELYGLICFYNRLGDEIDKKLKGLEG